MGPESNLVPMTEYPIILTEGGDDRLPLSKETGTNKYHQKPYVQMDTHFRGSCTCNAPTMVANEAALEAY